ncbi:MAG: cupin domain-containing protein [bacterium]
MISTPIFKPEKRGGKHQKTLLPSQVFPLVTPLAADEKIGWQPYPIFHGQTRNLKHLSCHASSLMPEKCPHPPHQHDDEEFMLILSGEVDLILPTDTTLGENKRRRMKAGEYVYYPADFPHSLEAVGPTPANYLMLKWSGQRQVTASPLAFLQGVTRPPAFSQNTCGGFSSTVCFEAPTGYLSKLHSHLSTITPGGGYGSHHDEHDVVIVMLEGEVESLGCRIGPHGVIYYAAGEPHGMRNPGSIPARYLVMEYHGLKAAVRPIGTTFLSIAAWAKAGCRTRLAGLNKARQWLY